MTGVLKVDASKLTSTATSFQSSGNQIKNLTTQMTTLVSGLTGEVWSGDAATAYVNKFKQLQDDINRMVAMVNEHVTDLQAMAQEYAKAENANITAANALSSDVIV